MRRGLRWYRYKVIQRLCQDDSPSNGYRNAATISTTGGGSGLSLPMLFLTDVAENKAQRASLARLMKACGMFEPGDWLITVHASGNFYRYVILWSSRNCNCITSVMAKLQRVESDLLFINPAQVVQ